MRLETVREKPTKFRTLGCNKHAGEYDKVGGENILVGVMHLDGKREPAGGHS